MSFSASKSSLGSHFLAEERSSVRKATQATTGASPTRTGRHVMTTTLPIGRDSERP
jgi:hypothetical protein